MPDSILSDDHAREILERALALEHGDVIPRGFEWTVLTALATLVLRPVSEEPDE